MFRERYEQHDALEQECFYIPQYYVGSLVVIILLRCCTLSHVICAPTGSVLIFYPFVTRLPYLSGSQG